MKQPCIYGHSINCKSKHICHYNEYSKETIKNCNEFRSYGDFLQAKFTQTINSLLLK